MNDTVIKLHPKSYKEISDKIIFYLNEQRVPEKIFEAVFNELRSAKTLVVTSYKKNSSAERRYSLYVGQYILNFLGSDYWNLQCINVYYDRKKVTEKKKNLYKTKIFTIIPTGGVYVVYNKQIHPEVEDSSWKMEQDVYNGLLDSMEKYFEAGDTEEEGTEGEKEQFKISERFRRNILTPFKNYTDKEKWVEFNKQSQGEGITYYRREFLRKNDKGSVYGFYSKDENADPEKHFFNKGDRITVIDPEKDGENALTGTVDDIDDESDDGVIFAVSFYQQTDDVSLPNSGKLIMGINDTQTNVRKRVIRSMERGKIESKYMYRVFGDFKAGGYEDVPEDFKDYLAEKMADKYPPNQMQLEAIIKGVLTEDLLLVLGPPGTGKTTVISFWVEYFIRKHKRVLISSQNNAAVDNVLARFGKIAETVRLGNEDKVQDNCKEYLPQHKIATMQASYNENHERVVKDILHNKEEIKKYGERLQKYQKLIDDYVQKKDAVRRFSFAAEAAFLEVIRAEEEVKRYASEIDSKMEYRAHKELFLQVYETKSFLEKLLKKRYAKRVKSELESGEEELKKLRSGYSASIQEYHRAVGKVREFSIRYRESGVVTQYNNAKNALLAYMENAARPEFLPQFSGEITALYHSPRYQKKLQDDLTTVPQQRAELGRIQGILSKMEHALGEWNSSVNNERNDIMQNALLETCQIVGATCIGINSNRDFANVKFDVAIVDESGQIQIHNALIPMSRAGKNLLLGDYKQIPPCANEDVIAACEADEEDTALLNMSFFEYIFQKMRKNEIDKLEEQGLDKSEMLKPVLEDYEPKPYQRFAPEMIRGMIDRVIKDPKKIVNLNSQFRMPGNISDIISEWFYEGNYHSSYNMDNFVSMVPGTDKPLVVMSTGRAADHQESQPASKMGYQNHYEARLIAKIVAAVIEAQPEDKKVAFIDKIEEKIGIISAYGAQVKLIREYLSKMNLGIREIQIRSMVASLDSFQGQERPLILYSLTRSTTYKRPADGRVGFMKELRRLNVAFTRCQKQLVIVGDIDYLKECMKMERITDEDKIWPCAAQEEPMTINDEIIEQCAECPAVCERKFARFMRLLMQHVNAGAGNLLQSEDYLKRNA